jgi:hypothetical protein
MFTTIQFIAIARQQMVNIMDGLTIEQINKTPQGFNNNLIWNLAHVVATFQNYTYRRSSGLDIAINENLITDYGNGSFPKEFVAAEEIEDIKKLAVSTIDNLKNDIEKGSFKTYTPFEVTAGKVNLQTLDDCLSFMLFHESMHLGTMKALKTAVAV